MHIGADRREFARELERREAGAQVFADLAFDVGGIRDQRVERRIFAQPLRRGLGTDLVDARDVVGAVAHEREVVDDLLGEHVELRLHARAIEHRAAHRVDERDLRRHELRHVLVAGGDEHARDSLSRPRRPACRSRRRLPRPASRRMGKPMPRTASNSGSICERRSSGIGGRCALYSANSSSRNVLPGRVEHHRDALGVVVLEELRQHVEHAEHRAGGFAARVAERRQRVKRAIQIRRAVDEDEIGAVVHAATSAAAWRRLFLSWLLRRPACRRARSLRAWAWARRAANPRSAANSGASVFSGAGGVGRRPRHDLARRIG